ncbi:MarR family winged helix-turn-helix transcriptional regulator [Leucobacter sp. Psy1]|uniref:MarR family winged helix-turn-helix transcriptional regulator n=1 Tax=Leucobacter sp. Psy1 TaxID=2875729 RepID=UPI001CD7AA69|nr:MarR family transcriptional regulator [Leucobacter sp. Psy1]
MTAADELRNDADGRSAVDLIVAASRFTRRAGRVPGFTYSSTAWRVLAELEQRGPMRISDLVHLQRVTQPTMTSLVQRLEGEEWVVREPDPHDGRATLVRLTDCGITALGDYRRAAAARVAPLLAELTEFDRATLTRAAELLERMSDHPALS